VPDPSDGSEHHLYRLSRWRAAPASVTLGSLRVGVSCIAASVALVLSAPGCDAAREDYANLSANDARYNAFAILARLKQDREVARGTTMSRLYRDVRPNGGEAWLAVLGGGRREEGQKCLALWATRALAELVHYQLFPCDRVTPLLKARETSTND
jgi:hypothetical protein